MNAMESLQSQAPDYRETFVLTCAPFENRIDPKFFYASTALMQRLDLLTHLTQFGESVVLVAGPAGSGKTSLLETFVNHANNRWEICLLDGTHPQQVPGHLSRAFGTDASTGVEDALSQWDARTDSSRLFVILVDDADKLDQQTCDDLCRLLTLPQGERVRAILFGTDDAQPRVKKALEQHTSSRSMQLLEVPRLSEEETASYLLYRLAVAGYSGESPFTATEVRAICKAADGRPAATNTLAHQTLTEHVLRANSKRQHSVPATGGKNGRLWLAATGGLLILVALIGWLRFTSPENTGSEPQLAEAPFQEGVPLTIPATNHAAGASVPSVEQPTLASETASELPDAGDEIPLPVPETASRSIATDVSATPSQTQAPLPAATTRTIPGTKEASPPRASSLPETPDVEDPKKAAPVQAEKTTVPTPTAEAPGFPHRESWLLNQPEDRYSLQLLGSRNEKSIARYIAQHKLDPRQTAYYRGLFKNAEWYVLVYGVYPSRDAALKQIETLPAAVRKERPWPRDMKSVHLAIKAAQTD